MKRPPAYFTRKGGRGTNRRRRCRRSREKRSTKSKSASTLPYTTRKRDPCREVREQQCASQLQKGTSGNLALSLKGTTFSLGRAQRNADFTFGSREHAGSRYCARSTLSEKETDKKNSHRRSFEGHWTGSARGFLQNRLIFLSGGAYSGSGGGLPSTIKSRTFLEFFRCLLLASSVRYQCSNE